MFHVMFKTMLQTFQNLFTWLNLIPPWSDKSPVKGETTSLLISFLYIFITSLIVRFYHCGSALSAISSHIVSMKCEVPQIFEAQFRGSPGVFALLFRTQINQFGQTTVRVGSNFFFQNQCFHNISEQKQVRAPFSHLPRHLTGKVNRLG